MTDVLEHPVRAEAEPFVNRFVSLSAAGRQPRWIERLRKAAMAWFAESGFPTARHEEWEFTNITPLTSLPLEPIEAPARHLTLEDIRPFTFGQMDCHRLVFVDGHFVAALSSPLPKQFALGSLREHIAANDRNVEKYLGQHAGEINAFGALNAAFFQDGAYVSVPAGRVVDKPVHLLFVATATEPGATAYPRNLILAGKASDFTVLETYASLSESPYVTNAVTELILDEDARVEHIKIQNESEQAFHVAAIDAQQGRGSRWASHSISCGARLARNQIQSALDGEGAECLLNGLYVGRGEQLVDHHTVVNHLQPHCESHEFYHGILDGRSRGVFNGKIFVQQDAQKTNAKQTNRNLLLSDDAMIDTKPQLEIFADDVKCTHGATVGQLDPEQLFYLRARGLGLEKARRMLIRAFANEVVERIPIEAVRAELDRVFNERFV